MPYDQMKILHQGDEYGNGIIVRISLSTGRKILALATKNLYAGDWDLGPTWNYVIGLDRPFLLDAGRRGTGPALMEMMEYAGLKARDLDFVVLSHGHKIMTAVCLPYIRLPAWKSRLTKPTRVLQQSHPPGHPRSG